MKRFFIPLFFFIVLIVLFNYSAEAQCALCKATAESSLQEGNNSARGLNIGIFYLLVVPYALIGGIGYWWYKNNMKKKSEASVGSKR